jgi:hypothetical protein
MHLSAVQLLEIEPLDSCVGRCRVCELDKPVLDREDTVVWIQSEVVVRIVVEED